MNIGEIDNIVGFIVNRSQTGNASPQRRNWAYNLANLYLFKRYLGIPEEWQVGMPLSKIMYSESSYVENALKNFKVTKFLTIDDNGQSVIPSDYIKEDIITYITQDENGKKSYTPVKILNSSEQQEALNSYVVPPTFDNPTCTFYGTYIQFYPEALATARMVYLRLPKTPVYGYTVVNGRPVYDPSTSVQLEFPDNLHNDFIMLACQYLGVNMERNELIQYTEQIKHQGQ